ncbi:AIDA-1b, partial [Aphelenchoides avenae]
MGPKELSNSSQDFFEYCRRGNVEKVNAWLLSKSKKSKSPLNFLRPSTPSAGWLTHLRDPLNAYTALHQAALHGHLEVAQQLVRHDPDLVNARDRRGCLPLHLAAWNGHHLVVQYLLKEEPSTVDAVNNAKECPLHLAAQHGHAYVTSVLLQNHADARLRNARFETALDIAARMGKEGVCKLLIYNCPELALQSAAECTSAENRALASHVVYPLHAAARHGHIECLSILCDAGFDVNFVTDEGSALHVAALFGQLDAVRLLLKYGVDVSIRDCQGRTVLEKLHEHENQKASDLTQVIQSREGWSTCRECIEEFIATNPQQHNAVQQDASNVYLNFDSIPYSREVIWRTIPENSPAPHQTPPSSKRQSNGHAFHHPPSMT